MTVMLRMVRPSAKRVTGTDAGGLLIQNELVDSGMRPDAPASMMERTEVE